MKVTGVERSCLALGFLRVPSEKEMTEKGLRKGEMSFDRDLLARRRKPISCSEKPGRSSHSVSSLSHISHRVKVNH